MLDFTAATSRLIDLIGEVRNDQLDAKTPCANTSIGDLLDHVDTFSLVFATAATKSPLPSDFQGPTADASRLGTDWRTRIPERLNALASAWGEEDAWMGLTQAAGQEVPAEIAGAIALDEVIVHSWDIAAATGQGYTCESDLVATAIGFVEPTVAKSPEGTPGLFGPPVAVAADEPILHKLLGLTGRDPRWSTGGGDG
jgi:uncharacterized protein (TIGR03086 family)